MSEVPGGSAPPAERAPLGEEPAWYPTEVKAPSREDAWAPLSVDEENGASPGLLTMTVVAMLGLALVGAAPLYRWMYVNRLAQMDGAAIQTVVDRIILVESSGDANARNKRSSATGAAQFLDATWLEMIRAHRPDLAQGRNDKQVLDLRRDFPLAREITTRWVERNATMLSRRGLPVTPSTLYLTYFAGPAGAVAILSVPDHLDAAALMASADASGHTTREKIVTANPFLGSFTVGDLKSWADRKMRGL